MYIRTDIGGTYRFDYKDRRFHTLIPHVTMFDLSETFPTAIALDEHNPDRLLVISGINGQKEGVFAVSDDRGETFTYHKMPTFVHGNWNGRGTGYRLVQDVSAKDTYYYARTSGQIVVNKKYWITKNNDLLPVGYYTFDENGKMIDPPTA